MTVKELRIRLEIMEEQGFEGFEVETPKDRVGYIHISKVILSESNKSIILE